MPNLVNVQTGETRPIPYDNPEILQQVAQAVAQSGGQLMVVDDQGNQIDPSQLVQAGGGGGMQEGDLMSTIQHIQQGMQNGTIQPSAGGGLGPAASGAPDPSMMGPDPMLAAGQQAQATGHQPGQVPNLIQERLLGG